MKSEATPHLALQTIAQSSSTRYSVSKLWSPHFVILDLTWLQNRSLIWTGRVRSLHSSWEARPLTNPVTKSKPKSRYSWCVFLSYFEQEHSIGSDACISGIAGPSFGLAPSLPRFGQILYGGYCIWLSHNLIVNYFSTYQSEDKKIIFHFFFFALLNQKFWFLTEIYLTKSKWVNQKTPTRWRDQYHIIWFIIWIIYLILSNSEGM